MLLNNLFKLTANNTTIRREIIGGITTFMTMSYIIFVQPVVLSACGMDKGAVMVATCLSSALAMILMAFLANYPIALAPAMGHNFYFAYVVCVGMGVSWQVALGANFISGMVFITLAFFGLREKLINSVPQVLKNAIAVGIGLLIALIGLEWSGIIVQVPGTFIGLGDIKNPSVLLTLFGVMSISILLCLKVRGAILIGMMLSAIIALFAKMIRFEGVISTPPSITPTFLQLDIPGALKWNMLGVIFTLFFLDLFDTVGTLIGVGQEAGFMKEGELPRAKGALLSDAIGTVVGTSMGTSTVTSYIESSTGVAEGARTGLANLVTAGLFLASIFLYPLIKMISAGVHTGNTVLYPVIAPALIIVGVVMLANVSKIDWKDHSEAVPAFLTMVIMSFSFSITEGISFGFISYTVLKAVTGRFKEVPILVSVFSALFILRYIFL